MLWYVTTNEGKVTEAEAYLRDGAISQFDFDYPERQAPTLAPIAAAGARAAYREVGEPVLVDDAGLFIDGLEGFPGPYSSYVENTLGIERVSELAESLTDARAAFRCALAYCDGDDITDDTATVDRSDDSPPVALFEGSVPGYIVAPRGDGGFGYDPIFEHDGDTLAEMDTDQKNAVSHRGRALERFATWYADRRVSQ